MSGYVAVYECKGVRRQCVIMADLFQDAAKEAEHAAFAMSSATGSRVDLDSLTYLGYSLMDFQRFEHFHG